VELLTPEAISDGLITMQMVLIEQIFSSTKGIQEKINNNRYIMKYCTLLILIIIVAYLNSCGDPDYGEFRKELAGSYTTSNIDVQYDSLKSFAPSIINMELDRCSQNKVSTGQCEAIILINKKTEHVINYKTIWSDNEISSFSKINFEYPSNLLKDSVVLHGNYNVDYITEEELQISGSLIFNDENKLFTSPCVITFAKS
jgi:hypothetical protein